MGLKLILRGYWRRIMKEYDVEVEFEILYTILDSLRNYNFVTNEHNKKCIAYISDKITNLMDPDPIKNMRGNSFDPLNLPKDYMENIIPANMEEEIHFAPDDFEYEFYNACTDDIIESPKRSNVMP